MKVPSSSVLQALVSQVRNVMSALWDAEIYLLAALTCLLVRCGS